MLSRSLPWLEVTLSLDRGVVPWLMVELGRGIHFFLESLFNLVLDNPIFCWDLNTSVLGHRENKP